ncbi:LCP family protein [Streptacidiphilus cavernicola]|uniref:LCP family protein n=1 Tax=Streptacidiphilus cavernicola TaxID=3342716 RepID=A0ABV6VTA4_9ACTN
MSGDVNVPEDEQKRSFDEESTPPEPSAGPPRWPRILRRLALAVVLALIAGAGAVWYGYQKYDRNITTDTTTETLLGPPSARPTVPAVAYNAENILIIGSDTRSGPDSSYGDANGGARSDTTILLHLSQDRTRAVAMSIPRDAMVHIPACTLPDGGHTAAAFAQFNWAYSFGGTACTIRTVEQLTKIRIDHFMVIDFNGFKNMVNAIGGVQVCLAKPVDDRDAKLHLPAGKQTVNGTQALGFVRVRETIGDGSDTERMGRQQQFLSSLVQKVESNGVLLNPTKLLPLIGAATSAITVDPGLNTLGKLYDLATSLRAMPADHLVLLTAPREPYVNDHNRDQFQQPQADQLFQQIRDDDQVLLNSWAAKPATHTGTPSASTPSTAAPATPAPAFDGRTADQDICSSS